MSVDFFFKINFFEKILSAILSLVSVSNNLDPDQAGHIVRLDLSPNCLQTISAEDTGRQNVNLIHKCANLNLSIYYTKIFARTRILRSVFGILLISHI